MSKRIFVPVESYCLASPEIKLKGGHTDIGQLAEALILFDECDVSVSSGQNLSDILASFLRAVGSIGPFLDLLSAGSLRIHFFDFFAAPIKVEGSFIYYNIQDEVAERSHPMSFEQKVLYHPAIEAILPKARHRHRLYEAVRKSSVIDGSADYGAAIEAAREASKSHEEMEYILNSFRQSLPAEFRSSLPEKISVKASYDPATNQTKHEFNFNFQKLSPELPNLNFGPHIPGVGLLQTYRVLYASRRHGYDLYLPHPLADAVLAKMDSLDDHGRKFAKTTVELNEKASFPDVRTSFNEGALTWKDIIDIRSKGDRFRKWFAAYGGNPQVALATYGDEFRVSTGLTSYREKAFSIATYLGATAGAAIGAAVDGPAGAAIGVALAGGTKFVRDLFKASDEDSWKPRFFGDWIREKEQ